MENIIKTILYDWKNRKIPDPIARNLDLNKYISRDSAVKKIMAITGFRRSGKSYLMFQLINKLLQSYDREEVLYINFEDERIPLQTEFLTQLLPVIKRSFDKKLRFLFLDEIQNVPNWAKWLRRIYDTEDFYIFVTGSSSKLSSQEIPTELRGRCLEIKVFPLSLDEFFRFKNFKPDLSAIEYGENQKAEFMKLLDEYVYYGAMPEIALMEGERKLETLQQYYKTVVQKEIIERNGIKNREGLAALLRLLLNSLYYSVNKLYNTLKSLSYKIGKTNLLHYVLYIENSWFMYSLPIFSYKIKNQLQYARKNYFIDNGFISSLSTKFSNNFGRLYENLVFMELKRKSLLSTDIFYWKDDSGKEVDFVITENNKIIQLTQVCYEIGDEDTKKREIQGLLKASEELKCQNLLIINRDLEKVEIIKTKKIQYIPLWKWLLVA